MSGEHEWLSDGSLVQARRHESRMAFIESETWDPIWKGLAELIGLDIEHLVIVGSRRAVNIYMRQMVPAEALKAVQAGDMDIRPVIEAVFAIAEHMGYGSLSLEDIRYQNDEGDFAVIRYTEPFSLPLAVASVAGTTEALTARENMSEYTQVAPDTYDIRIFPAEHAAELKTRLTTAPYEPSAGGVELERCGTCGAPAGLKEYEWDLERGVIRGRETGRRMAMIGPQMIDPVFEELEAELGSEIPRMVVEAQRRFVRTGPFRASEITGTDEMLRQFALRGLGELTDLHMGKKGVRVTIANAVMHLWVVGAVQGLYELVFGEGSSVDWELQEGGRLEIEVSPALDQT